MTSTSAYPSPPSSVPSPVASPQLRPPHQPPRVAVVGSGLAGLTAAYLLRREGADVYLIEKLGFHAWSVELDAKGRPVTSVSAGEAAAGKEEAADMIPNPTSRPSSLVPPNGPTPPPRKRTCSSSSIASIAPVLPTSTPSSAATSTSTTSGMKRSPSFRGDTVAVDVPMRSFQGGYYPLVIALYNHLRLPIKPEHFSFSFASLRPRRKVIKQQDTYFIHSGASGLSLPSLPAHASRNTLRITLGLMNLVIVGICYVALLITAFLSWHGLLPASLSGDASFLTVVEAISNFIDKPISRLPRTRLGPQFKAFATDIVLPLFSAVGTMTEDDVWSTPAVHILDYIHAGVGTAHYSLGEGKSARDVSRLLAAPIRKQGNDHLRLGSAIRSIRYNAKNSIGGVTVLLDGGGEIDVDCVVIATPARAARHLLGTFEPSLAVAGEKAEARRVARMRTALADVAYRDTIVTTHQDRVVLPLKADVRDINLVQPMISEHYYSDQLVDLTVSPGSPSPSASSPVNQLGDAPFFPPTPGAVYTMATHVIQPPGGRAPVYQTTNPVIPIDADAVLGVARLERALPLRDANTLSSLHAPSTTRRPLVYLAGSYAYPGIPLLEGCVGSARRVVEDLFALPENAATGGVDWNSGRGGLVGRIWRWRLRGRGGYN